MPAWPHPDFRSNPKQASTWICTAVQFGIPAFELASAELEPRGSITFLLHSGSEAAYALKIALAYIRSMARHAHR